jgi:hypothetical protein
MPGAGGSDASFVATVYDGGSAPRRRPRPRRTGAVIRRRQLAAGAGLLVILALAVAVLGGGGGNSIRRPPLPGLGEPARAGDPFAYDAGRSGDFVARATAGESRVLFTQSPGGVLATADRVAGYRGQIVAATRGTGVDPEVLEAIVFLESAGRPNVLVGGDPVNAAGLTQILAATGQSLLGMHIDLGASRRLTRQIDAASAAGRMGLVARLERRRAAVDHRFDPARALAATVRYLRFADRQLGHSDLAIESYHMGVSNLKRVLGLYDGGRPVPYAQVYFDCSPTHNPETYRLLTSFSDDSSTYLWRVLGALNVMRLYRQDRAALKRLAALQTAYPSAAEVLQPPDRTPSFADPASLSDAYSRRVLIPLPRNDRALGLAYAVGSPQGADPKVPTALYRGLRAPALDLLVELAARVRALSGSRAPLTVISTVTDRETQRRIGNDDPPAATGYTFQILRRYRDHAQAGAFQAMLDRLQALNLIAWFRGGATIEVTVAADADRVMANGV